MATKASRRMWLEVPPSGIGAPVAMSPGSSQRNHVSYSTVNQR
jgi:hypothetical protein